MGWEITIQLMPGEISVQLDMISNCQHHARDIHMEVFNKSKDLIFYEKGTGGLEEYASVLFIQGRGRGQGGGRQGTSTHQR